MSEFAQYVEGRTSCPRTPACTNVAKENPLDVLAERVQNKLDLARATGRDGAEDEAYGYGREETFVEVLDLIKEMQA